MTLEDIEREMDRLAIQFRSKATEVNRDGKPVSEITFWTNSHAETRYNELQQRYTELAKGN